MAIQVYKRAGMYVSECELCCLQYSYIGTSVGSSRRVQIHGALLAMRGSASADQPSGQPVDD